MGDILLGGKTSPRFQYYLILLACGVLLVAQSLSKSIYGNRKRGQQKKLEKNST